MLPEKEVIESAKKMLNISLEECSQTRLDPYYKKSKLPAVSFNLFCLLLIRPYKLPSIYLSSSTQADDPFWKRKPQDKSGKQPRRKTFAVKKKKAAAGSGSHLEEDDPDSEV